MGAKDIPNKLPSGADMMDLPAGFDRERMDEVLKMKGQANDKFREGDYFAAKCLYSGALEMLERCCLHLEKSDTTWEGIKNNMALCDLKRQEWTRVVEATTEILTRNPSNTKALYRRGVAKAGQGKLQEAQRDLRLVVELEPDNTDARQKFSEIAQQMKSDHRAGKDQADKMRGFLRGERLDDTVPVSEDGGVRKLHGNENAPLYSSWIKRAWLLPKSGARGVVTAHMVIKTQAGKEVYNTRKPLGALDQQPAGPNVHGQQGKVAGQPAEPARWVVDDDWGGVFHAWNAAAKAMQLHELGRFEVAKHTLGPSVEAAIERCSDKWMSNMPLLQDAPEDIQISAKRQQALQILGLPEVFCAEPVADPNTTLSMEMELVGVREFVDLKGDGKQLLHILREGKKRSPDTPVAKDLSTVSAHFSFSKLLNGYAMKDTRFGLANTSEGLVMKLDRSKEPVDFVVGEEVAPTESGEFVPPYLAECLMLPPNGVVEGMHFQLILRDGVPAREMERSLYHAHLDGTLGSIPDTSGPICIHVEVERVVPACDGPSTLGWKGLDTIQRERRRAEELEEVDEGRHRKMALKRWQRIIVWLEAILQGRRWKLEEGFKAGASSMYDLEWDDEEEEEGEEAPKEFIPPPGKNEDAGPVEISNDLLSQLQEDELAELAIAHAAVARHLETASPSLSERHAASAVQASSVGKIPKDVEITARSRLAKHLLAASPPQTCEALKVLRVAQTLDPTSQHVRDMLALAIQKDSELKTFSLKDTLRTLKTDLNSGIEAGCAGSNTSSSGRRGKEVEKM